MKSLTSILAIPVLATLASVSTAAGAERPLGDLGRVGTVHFATACDPAQQPEFERGVALLHSFFYSEARRVFTAVAAADPECAMAHWGVAMTYYHPLWTAPDSSELAAGLAAVDRAIAAKKQDDRGRAYVGAIEAYYRGTGAVPVAATTAAAASCHAGVVTDSCGRAPCFKREMGKVSAAYPEDVDASAFYALSLIATSPPGDPKLVQPLAATAILERWYAKFPDHPGLVHYLIHGYDYPPIAARGLAAAKAYAGIAPEVPHALHMPSHIFTRLGMWDETIQSNLASADAARRFAAANHAGAASFEELHALDYMMYAYLQTAQDENARRLVARLAEIEKTFPSVDFAAGYAFGAMPARFALERRQWKEAAELQLKPMPFWSKLPFTEGHIVYARAVGAARSGDLSAARAAAARLGELVTASTEPRLRYFADQMQIQRDAALGLIAFAEGRKDSAIATLRAAAAREDFLGKHPVSPGAMLPVRELLAETLLDSGKPAEALAEFEASLAINPGRFNGVCGAARAAAAAGRAPEARKHYAALVALARAGEGARSELGEAKQYLAGH